MRRALAGDADRADRHPQGRRRLSAARPELSTRAARLHAAGCPRDRAGQPLGAARATARPRCAHRLPRCRLGRHRPPARHRAGQRPAAAKHRLRHLHLGLHRSTEGRRRRSRKSVEQGSRARKGLRRGTRLPHRSRELVCIRSFDRAGDSALGPRRFDRRHQRCNPSIARRILEPSGSQEGPPSELYSVPAREPRSQRSGQCVIAPSGPGR